MIAALGLMFAAAAQAQFKIKLPKQVTNLAKGKLQSVLGGQTGQGAAAGGHAPGEMGRGGQ